VYIDPVDVIALADHSAQNLITWWYKNEKNVQFSADILKKGGSCRAPNLTVFTNVLLRFLLAQYFGPLYTGYAN